VLAVLLGEMWYKNNMATNTTRDSDADQRSREAVLTVADAARFLRISESVVRRLIRERRIPHFRIDGRYLLYRPAVESWISSILVLPGGCSNAQEAEEIAARLWNEKEGI
jgi:excisionase family DNA binding protein